MIDYLRVLDIDINVTGKPLRDAYRFRVLQADPRLGGSPAEYAQVKEAYETLSDPARRVEYFIQYTAHQTARLEEATKRLQMEQLLSRAPPPVDWAALLQHSLTMTRDIFQATMARKEQDRAAAATAKPAAPPPPPAAPPPAAAVPQASLDLASVATMMAQIAVAASGISQLLQSGHDAAAAAQAPPPQGQRGKR